MAFDIIFGDSAEPGSSDVYDKILLLNDRLDVERFCCEIRAKAGGGWAAVEKRRIQAVAYEKTGREALSATRYKEAYNAFINATNILGGFTYDLLLRFVETLLGLKRFEEAAAFAFTARSCNGKKCLDNTSFVIAYSCLGFTEGLGTYKWPRIVSSCLPTRQLDIKDFDETLNAILEMDSSKTWDQLLFLLTHAHCHLEYGSTQQVSAYLKTRTDFIPRIQSNRRLLHLFTRPSFVSCDASELRFLGWFMKFISSWIIATQHNGGLLAWFTSWFSVPDLSSSVASQLLNEKWYRSFIHKFGISLLSEKAATKLAMSHPYVFDDVIGGWLVFSEPLFKQLHEIANPDNVLSAKPFDDFSLCCQAAALCLFGGIKYKDGDSLRSGLANFSQFFVENILKLLSKGVFSPSASKMNEESLRKSLDLLVLLNAIAFAEWKLDFIRNSAVYDDCDIKPVTPRALLELSDNALNNIFLAFKESKEPDFLIDQQSLLVQLSRRSEFLSANLGISTDKGRRNLLDIISLFASATEMVGWLHQLWNLSQCVPFANNLVVTMASTLPTIAYQPHGDDDADFKSSKSVIELITCLACMPPSCLPKLLTAECTSAFVECAFDLEHSGAVFGAQFMAVLLRSANACCRRRWIKSHQPQLRRMSLLVFEKLLHASDMPLGEAINYLLCFHAIFGQSPQLASLEEVVNNCSDGDAEGDLLALASEIATIIFDDDESRFAPPFNALIYQEIFLNVSGLVIATVFESNLLTEKQMISIRKSKAFKLILANIQRTTSR